MQHHDAAESLVQSLGAADMGGAEASGAADAAEEQELSVARVLLEANGYSAGQAAGSAQVIKLAGQITKLEMFLQDYPKMLALPLFSALTELCLIDQRIERIEGLQGCPHLKKLWLIENRISVIENLEPCTALQELYLTSNMIAEVAGLQQLTNLQVLWLADNFISNIAGVSQLPGLQQLNLARNDIAAIGNSLQHSSCLTSLNLAHNHISSLQDVVSGLSSLSRLQDLCFVDPFWGGCPVASLSNYQTIVLAHLPQLSSLDTLVLARETKQAAAATSAKKQLYYSMRMRTLGRAVRDLCRKAQEGMQVQAAVWVAAYQNLAYAAKQLQQGAGGDQQQQQELRQCTQSILEHLAQQHAALGCARSSAMSQLQLANTWLQLELSSAGNIWLEQVAPTDDRFQWCQGLLSCGSSQAGGTASGTRLRQVQAVARIHNRFLRSQFTGHVQPGCIDQHMILVRPAADVMSIVQHGLSPRHNSVVGQAPIILFSHMDPLEAGATCSRAQQALICRVCLEGPCRALPNAGQLDTITFKQFPGVMAVYANANTGVNCAAAKTYAPAYGSKPKPAAAGVQPRRWAIFDATAVLPEYLVTWQCAATPASQSSPRDGPAVDVGCKDPLLRVCARPLARWLDVGGQQDQQNPALQDAESRQLQERCTAATAAVRCPPCPTLRQLTSASLAQACGGQQLQSLTCLVLQDCGCSSFQGLLGHLPSLQALSLPFNKLTSLQGLDHGAANTLAVLDVSHNTISAWDSTWLARCSALTSLDISCNCITQPANLQRLSRSLPHLQSLDLTLNPVQQHKAYRLSLAALTGLTSLDGMAADGTSLLCNGASSLSQALLQHTATLWHSNTGPVPVLHTLGSEDWRLLLHSVVLDGQGLTGLTGIAAASNLVAASFADNLIISLTDLCSCTRLQRLNISSNLVAELQPLSSLTSLQQLDISGNQVSSLAGVSGLVALSQLNCEGNTITSLAAASGLSSLVELYAANNHLSDAKEVNCLAALPRLMVLDLVGNPLVDATEGYRPLLLFKLARLKVLDGVAADAAELAAAHEQHAGRLTMDMLVEQLGIPSSNMSSLRQLDVCAMGLRDLGTVFAAGGPLTALTALNLDGNHLTSLAPLAGLSRLVLLSLSNNMPSAGGHSCCSLSFAGSLPPEGVAGSSGPLLPSLQTLHLASCGLTSLVPLQLGVLPALRGLFVQGNDLTRLDGLEGCEQLRELVADRNKLRVLEPEVLSGLVRLQELRLEDNLIKSISPTPVTALPQLRVLHLGNNRLLDALECCQRLSSMPQLLELAVAGNPFTRKHGYRPLLISQCSQLLVIDNQPVTPEERDVVAASMAAADSPRHSLEVPQYTAAMLLAATAASAAEARAGLAPPPSSRVGPGSSRSAGLDLPSPKAAAPAGPSLPVVLGFEGLASLTAARQVLMGLGPGGLQPGAAPAPSIQSGILVLTGPASFGLEGTSLRAHSTGGGSSSALAGPATSSASKAQQQQSSPSGGTSTARSSTSRRTTTGSIASHRAGGFVVRQATFK